MSAWACERCRERGKTWQGDDPICGFSEEGIFLAENWACATLGALRELMGEAGDGEPGVSLWYDDMRVGVIGRPEPEEGGHAGFMLARWYKHRGRTEDVLTWPLHETPRGATLGEVEEVLRSHEAKGPKG